jgi:hypothetical protein
MNFVGKVPVYQGVEERIGKEGAALSPEVARFIVREEMRKDVRTPLSIACGAWVIDFCKSCVV